MSRAKWHSGPPPSVGWWPASIRRDESVFRWWNGRNWSDYALKTDPAKLVARVAANEVFFTHEIEWRDRPKSWPARSRT